MPSYHLMSLAREVVSGHALHTSHIAALAAASIALGALVTILRRRADQH
jgi:hypothetical protein